MVLVVRMLLWLFTKVESLAWPFFVDCDGRHAKLYTAEPIHNKPITSPSYPSAHGYTVNCLWLIERSFFNDDNYILKVVFNDFDLEDGSSYPCIGADALTFYDGPSPKSPSLGKYCGRSHPDVIYSTGQYLFVNFHGFIFKHRGFSFNVSAVKKGKSDYHCYTVTVLYIAAKNLHVHVIPGFFFNKCRDAHISDCQVIWDNHNIVPDKYDNTKACPTDD